MAVVIAQRIKNGSPAKDAHNWLRGFTLGVLKLQGEITEAQFDSGQSYANLVYRHAGIMGLPMPMPKSPDTTMVAGGLSCTGEPDDEAVLGVRRDFRDARRALLDVGVAIGTGSRVNGITYEVCIENRHISTLEPTDYRNLRVGLTALGKVFK